MMREEEFCKNHTRKIKKMSPEQNYGYSQKLAPIDQEYENAYPLFTSTSSSSPPHLHLSPLPFIKPPSSSSIPPPLHQAPLTFIYPPSPSSSPPHLHLSPLPFIKPPSSSSSPPPLHQAPLLFIKPPSPSSSPPLPLILKSWIWNDSYAFH